MRKRDVARGITQAGTDAARLSRLIREAICRVNAELCEALLGGALLGGPANALTSTLLCQVFGSLSAGVSAELPCLPNPGIKSSNDAGRATLPCFWLG